MAENENVTTTSTGSGEQLKPEARHLETDTPPKDLLAELAAERGLQPSELEVLPKKELQALIDSKITQAIRTREEKMKKAAEEEQLKAEKRYEELYSLKTKELEEERLRLEDEKRSLEQERVATHIKSSLAEAKLESDWAEYITAKDSKSAEKAVELFSKRLNAHVDRRIKELQEKGISVVGKKNNQGVDYAALVQPFIQKPNNDPFAKFKQQGQQ